MAVFTYTARSATGDIMSGEVLYLNGATLDWEKTLLRQGFKFLNPNEKSNCGCGTSFTV